MSDKKELAEGVDPEAEKSNDLVTGEYSSPIATLLGPGYAEKYQTLFNLADKSPLVDRKDMDKWDSNQDFIVFTDKQGNGNFDIQRGFALKAMRVFGFGKRDLKTVTTELKSGEVLVSITGTIYDTRSPALATEVAGACSTKETTAGKKSNNTRAYHDAVATAETRLLKRGVEELVGGPVINAMIKEIFGGFEIRGSKKMKNVSPDGKTTQERPDGIIDDPPEENKMLLRSVSDRLINAKRTGVITVGEFDDWKKRAILTIGTIGQLKNISGEIDKLIAERTGGQDA